MRGGAEIIIPPFFRCPISLDLFKDPVTLRTGQTYDRSCIEKWLAAGNFTCPVTMQKLPDPSMVPNHTLRHLIHDWLHSNGYPEPGRLDEDGGGDLSENRLKRIIVSDEFVLESKVRALEEVLALSQGLPFENSFLIELDFFRIVMERLFGDSESSVLVELELECGVKLMKFSGLGCLNTVLRDEASRLAMSRLFERGTVSMKKSLCVLIEAIAMDPDTEELCRKFGESEVVGVVVDVVKCGEAAEAGVRALSALSLKGSSCARANILARGGVEALVESLSMSASAATAAMAAIENMLSLEIGVKELLLSHPSGVKSVVKMVFRVSEHDGSESAVGALAAVCSDCERARERAISDGVLTQLLLLLQSQCSGRTKSKARQLLQLLRSK